MSAAVVEVKDYETFAFYKAYIKDFQNGKLLVHYEHGWRPDAWVDCTSVRQSVPPHNPALFDPRVGDSVEALAKSHEDEPFSWWRAKVKTIKGEFYLINYSDWDDTYNEIVEKELLRPPNPNPMLVATELTKRELDIPVELRQTEEERKDVMLQKQKQHQSAEMQQQSGVLTLLEDPNRNKLVILGHHKAVERATLLANMHFKHQKQLKSLLVSKQKSLKTLEEQKKRLENGYIEEFTVDQQLIGFVIGKAGSNIKRAEKAPGVQSIRVRSDNSQITIVAKDKESAQNARKMLEFVMEVFNVPRSQIGRFVGQKYSGIREIEKDSGAMRIRVPSNDQAQGGDDQQQQQQQRPRSNRGPARSFGADDEPVGIEVVGTRDSVHNAIMLMQQRLKYIIEEQTLVSEQRQVDNQLREFNANYGFRGQGRNNEREDGDANGDGNAQRRRPRNQQRKPDNAAAGTEAKQESKAAPTAEDAAAQAARRKKREEDKARRAANQANNAAAAGAAPATADAPAAAAAAPAATEKKPKKPRKPVNRTDEAAAATNDQQ